MKIYLDNLDSITKTKYKEFQDKVEKLLAEYQTTDSDRFKKVKNKIEQTNITKMMYNNNVLLKIINRNIKV